jgi:hypothetical protein
VEKKNMAVYWGHITEKMQSIVQNKISDGVTDMQLSLPGMDPIELRETVVSRMLRCVDTLTLQCMILDYDVECASETEGVVRRVNQLRAKIFDPALNIKVLGDMLQAARSLEVDLMGMLASRLKLFQWNDFVAEGEILGHLNR